MKGLALILLCVVAAAQARSSAVQNVSSRSLAVRGENPWFVHLRLAVSTSGFLNTCAGSLIASNWVLTSASCVYDARFIWNRFGAVNVLQPVLVLESSNVRTHNLYHPTIGVSNIALITFSRVIEFNSNISPVTLPSSAVSRQELPSSANFCAFGAEGDAPGELLNCFDVNIEDQGDVIWTESEDGQATQFDSGAPLVIDGVQFGILVSPPGPNDSNSGLFLPVSNFIAWIENETELSFSQ